MPDRRYRVLAVATHPVQYMSHLFRRMAAHPQLDFSVAYCNLRGAESGHDPEFGASVQWDVPLLDGYDWIQVRNLGSGNESFFGLNNPGLSQRIRRGKYDAVLCYVGYVRASFWIACVAAKLSNTAFLFGTDAASLAPRDQRPWKTVVKKIVWPRLFRLADQVIAPSSSTRALMLSLGIPASRVTMTPYSVDNDWWMQRSSQVDRQAVRESWSASPDTFVVLFCAKLQPWKRPADLLQAFAKANIPDSLLVFAGDGPLRSQLESQADVLGVSSRVRFLGFVNQTGLPAVYSSADLMVLPSEYEPFAVVVNEAMCCGCPVAVSDRVGAGPDLVAPLNPELIFPVGDSAALANLLSTLSANPSRLRDLGRSGLAFMESWSPERNVAFTLEAIELAVSSKRRPAPNSSPVSTSKSSVSGSH